MAKGEKQTLH